MITFSNFTLEGKTRVKTVTNEKYPDTAVITKLAIESGQRSASIHFNTKAQELIGVEIPTQVVIIDNNGTFLIAAFDKVKEVNPELAQAFETRKMVYRLGMNGKVSSKAIHAALKNNEYILVVENEVEGIFRMEAILEEYTQQEAVVGFDYPSNNSTDAQSIVFPSEVIPTDSSNTTITSNVADRIEGILEEDLATVNNVEAYDEF
jgi:TPP-dependent indolepyruvate ferredoxin oxidoreductase alpha subunit